MMNWKTRLLFRESLFTAITFTLAAYLYYFFSFWGVKDHFSDWYLMEYMSSQLVHIEILVVGILFGTGIAVINRFTETPKLRQLSIIRLVLYRTLLYLVSFLIVSMIVIAIFVYFIYPWEVIIDMFFAMSMKQTLSFILWLIIVVGGINMALEIERIIGPQNIWGFLIGRYRRPHEEQRIFLFMDLKGSTTLAEELGHTRYSEFIQKCFHDLTQVVMQYEASIYQYVGDEVVISWSATTHKTNPIKSVQAFFRYIELLKGKEDIYRARFGIIPEFRGGIDLGMVTSIEVGDVKREIVYHGDPLNTASRLLELCKERNEKLVVSSAIAESAKRNDDYDVNWEKQIILRGKKIPVEASSIIRMNN